MEIMKVNDCKQIKQSNRLIEAKYKLTVYEQRMMIFICSQLNPNAAEFSKVRVSVADMASFCKFDETKSYSHVKSTIMRLMSRIVQIKMDDGGWYATHWLQKAKYIPSESVVEYEIDDELKPELLQLRAAYLSTPAAPLMEFRRDYSARLYFILKKMLKVGTFEYEIDFFRERFQLSKSYDIFFNFKNKVLEPAIAEINEKSDIDVEHKYVKNGRSYVSVKFTVILKKKKKKEALPSPPATSEKEEPIETQLERDGQTRLFDPATNEPPAPAVTGLTDEQEELIDRLISRGVSAKRAKKIVAEYPPAVIRANLKYAVQQKDTAKNLPGLIIKFIEEDIAGTQEKSKKEAKEKELERQRERRQAYGIVGGKMEEDEPEKIDLENISPDFKKYLPKKKGGE